MLPPDLSNQPILNIDLLRSDVEALRNKGKTIVLTNGCFDLVHAGHVSSLSFAKSLGNVLIVALNSDASIKRLKGPGRPILSAEYRARMVAALKPVDYVLIFETDTAIEIVQSLKPDFYVKSADYNINETPEGKAVLEYGGKVRTSPMLNGVSTSQIIERILLGYRDKMEEWRV